MTTLSNEPTTMAFTGLLAGLQPGHLQSGGLLDVVALLPTNERVEHKEFVSPLQHLKIVRVATYGTLVLENTASAGVLIAPMHVGFFQEGAQNHATSRVIILDSGETLTVSDCFCIQAAQGGYLKEAQQRFIILPLGLRKAALEKRDSAGFSRLWGDIDVYNRRYGIARGGHLERFLRPYFHRLLPFRHSIETLPGQVGAAYFVAGRLVGLEVTPNAAYWEDVGTILNIYCYGSAALLGERHQLKPQRQSIDMQDLCDLNDLSARLTAVRQQEMSERLGLINEVSSLNWDYSVDADTHKLRIAHISQGEWAGQLVEAGSDIVYLSAFRDVIA